MWSKDQNDQISKRSVQLVNIVQTEIFQSYVVDAIHVHGTMWLRTTTILWYESFMRRNELVSWLFSLSDFRDMTLR